MGKTDKFNIGDLVKVNKTGEIGTVIKIDNVMNSDYSVYIVKVGDFERLYTEEYISLYRDTTVINKVKNIDINDIVYSMDINEKIDSLINELELKKNNDEKTSLLNACLLVQYFSLRKKVSPKDVIKTNNLKLNELYDGLTSLDDNTANSYLFSEILNQLGISSYCVILKDSDDKIHVSNLVLIGEKYYYFDLSIERSIYADSEDKNFVFCCSGIGKENYEKFFTPLSLLTINDDGETKLPENISEEDIDFKLLNEIINREKKA